MTDATELTEASRLLEQYQITDGYVFALMISPGEIVIDCAFTTYVAKDEWKTQPARIRVQDPAGCQLAVRFPSEHGLIYAGELGRLDSIEASGALAAARFEIVFSYGRITVDQCLLTIEALDWNAVTALHAWLLVDRLSPGQAERFES